jgi:hypothetical protein
MLLENSNAVIYGAGASTGEQRAAHSHSGCVHDRKEIP